MPRPAGACAAMLDRDQSKLTISRWNGGAEVGTFSVPGQPRTSLSLCIYAIQDKLVVRRNPVKSHCCQVHLWGLVRDEEVRLCLPQSK